MSSYFNDEKMYTYLKGYAMGKNMPETILALGYARKLHNGQFRKSGEPYIIHPLTMCCQAIAMGIEDDVIIASLLLHDVVEDCNVSVNDLPCNSEVKNTVRLVTFKKPDVYAERDGQGPRLEKVKSDYYYNISQNEFASMVKIIDRCHNISTMTGAFTDKKIIEYISETENFVLPLLRSTKNKYPKYQNHLFILKYHIYSVLEAIKAIRNTKV